MPTVKIGPPETMFDDNYLDIEDFILADIRKWRARNEQLAKLVTPRLANLLEWLADKAEVEALSYLPHSHWTDPRIAEARALAARIKDSLS